MPAHVVFGRIRTTQEIYTAIRSQSNSVSFLKRGKLMSQHSFRILWPKLFESYVFKSISRKYLFEPVKRLQCYELTRKCSPLPLFAGFTMTYAVYLWFVHSECALMQNLWQILTIFTFVIRLKMESGRPRERICNVFEKLGVIFGQKRGYLDTTSMFFPQFLFLSALFEFLHTVSISVCWNVRYSLTNAYGYYKKTNGKNLYLFIAGLQMSQLLQSTPQPKSVVFL